MLRRRVRAAALIALALTATGATSGCDGTPEPVASTPSVLTEEEAFAAAEKTYRAYVDALNAVDLSDPRTFEALFSFSADELNASDRKLFSTWHAERVTMIGHAVVLTVSPYSSTVEDTNSQAVIDVCFDVTDVEVRAADGQSIVNDTRPNVHALRVTSEQRSDFTGWKLTSIEPSPAAAC